MIFKFEQKLDGLNASAANFWECLSRLGAQNCWKHCIQASTGGQGVVLINILGHPHIPSFAGITSMYRIKYNNAQINNKNMQQSDTIMVEDILLYLCKMYKKLLTANIQSNDMKLYTGRLIVSCDQSHEKYQQP